MGRMDVSALRYMSRDEFRVLQAVELGQRNHQLVSGQLVCALANLRSGGSHKLLRQLQNQRLLAYERGRRYDGYRLTVLGYDHLALQALTAGGHVEAFGAQIGTGKESDVYAAYDERGETLALKFHRLGRTSFRRLRVLRDYHAHRRHTSWLYVSSLSAAKEFAFMQALYARGFPVPRPVHRNRHAVLMSLVDGVPLCRVVAPDGLESVEDPVKDPESVEDPVKDAGVCEAKFDAGALYDQCVRLMVRLAECGVVHCDFNEFNLMVTDELQVVLIDLPQMVSTAHPNARELFDRDVRCLQKFFARRFNFHSEHAPDFDDIVRSEDLDAEVRASGYAQEFGDVVEEEEQDPGASSCDDDVEETGSDEESQEEDGEETGQVDTMLNEVDEKLGRVSLKPVARRDGEESDDAVVHDGDGDLKEDLRDTGCQETASSLENEEDSKDRNGDDVENTVIVEEVDSEEDPEVAAERCRELKRRGRQIREQQRLEARSRVSELVAQSAAERKRSHGAASSVASSIEPEQLARRLKMQQRRQERRANERRIRVKGDASAVTRVRRNNAANIRESTSGFWAGAY